MVSKNGSVLSNVINCHGQDKQILKIKGGTELHIAFICAYVVDINIFGVRPKMQVPVHFIYET